MFVVKCNRCPILLNFSLSLDHHPVVKAEQVLTKALAFGCDGMGIVGLLGHDCFKWTWLSYQKAGLAASWSAVHNKTYFTGLELAEASGKGSNGDRPVVANYPARDAMAQTARP
jgi:hypothetical protein